jgi:hypothetical protein
MPGNEGFALTSPDFFTPFARRLTILPGLDLLNGGRASR